MFLYSSFFPGKEDEKMFAKRVLQITLIVAVLTASLAIPRNAAAGSGCGNVYIVQPGDWLSTIANRCGVSLSALYAANPGVEFQLYIYPGQALNIPGGVPVPVTSQPAPVNPPGGCQNPYCQAYTQPYAGKNIPYFWYPSMIVTPRVGSSFYQATVYVGTNFTFQANVTNNGDVPLQVILNMTPPSGWGVNEEYNNCPDSLNVGNTCTYTWVFTPQNRGVVYVRLYARGLYTDSYGYSQRTTKSPAFFFNVY
jgi:LysM repeat protein